MNKLKVTVNFGHGQKDNGYDPGAIGPTGYQEATETREVGAKVVAKLKANGWDVLAIQDGDLVDVTNQSNAFGADYFISIHVDSFSDPNAHGTTSYALSSGGKGEQIAKGIQSELVAATGLTDRGVKYANYWVLKQTDCPAVLIEIGFISNPAEEALMKSDAWDEKIASAACRGFSKAVGVPYTERVVSVDEPKKVIAPDDIYLTVRVRESLADQAIKDINKLGFAAKKLELA